MKKNNVNKKKRHTTVNVNRQCQLIVNLLLTSPDNTAVGSYIYHTLKISREMWRKNKNTLMRIGLIKKFNGHWPPMYTLTNKAKNLNVNQSSYSTTKVDIEEKLGLHDVYIKIPIVDKSKAILPNNFWDKLNLKLNNNIQKHKAVKIADYNLSIRETSKHICIQMDGVDLKNFGEVFVVYNDVVNHVFQLLSKYNYWIDISKAECSDPELTYLSDLERKQKKENTTPKIKVNLGYPRAKILPNDQQEQAWAKFDNTPDQGNFETNDLMLATERRIFPLRVRNIENDMQTFKDGVNCTLNHLAVQIDNHLTLIQEYRKESVRNQERAKAQTQLYKDQGTPTTYPVINKGDRVLSVFLQDVNEFDFKLSNGEKIVTSFKKGNKVYLDNTQAYNLLLNNLIKIEGET